MYLGFAVGRCYVPAQAAAALVLTYAVTLIGWANLGCVRCDSSLCSPITRSQPLGAMTKGGTVGAFSASHHFFSSLGSLKPLTII